VAEKVNWRAIADVELEAQPTVKLGALAQPSELTFQVDIGSVGAASPTNYLGVNVMLCRILS
jgi:hypothetical protein